MMIATLTDVAQLVEPRTPNPGDAGSNPAGRANETEVNHAASGESPGRQIAGSHHPELFVHRAHGGLLRGSNSAAASQREQEIPAAWTQSGDRVLPSARALGATASVKGQRPAGAPRSLVRRTDGVAAVAQPGSAQLGAEVAGSNPVSGSVAGSIPAGVSTGAGCDSGDGEGGLVPSQVGRREERSSVSLRRAA